MQIFCVISFKITANKLFCDIVNPKTPSKGAKYTGVRPTFLRKHSLSAFFSVTFRFLRIFKIVKHVLAYY